jgi:S1-C subfamily serine protease
VNKKLLSPHLFSPPLFPLKVWPQVLSKALPSIVLIVGLAACQPRSNNPNESPTAGGNPAFAPVGNGGSSSQTDNFVVRVAQQVGPAVVSIDTTSGGEDSEDKGWRRQAPPEQGSGSGFIFTADGKILTNAHVVEGANKLTVNLWDGRQFPGKVIGADPLTDVAVVQIDVKGLPVVQFGNSRTLVPGQWAIAIGNPLGLQSTVTAGIVSATERPASAIGANDIRVRFIQTDVAINPGNSGGPLLDQQGKVIGMNTAILRDAQGLSFAIPIETVDRIAKQLIATGQVQRQYLGIRMVNLTPEIKRELNTEQPELKVKQDRGVLVVEVLPNSPASRAGLKPGDWLAKFNGKPMPSSEALQAAVEASPAAAKVQLELERQGQPLRVEVTLAPLPKETLERN